jgi:hypothetical protein
MPKCAAGYGKRGVKVDLGLLTYPEFGWDSLGVVISSSPDNSFFLKKSIRNSSLEVEEASSKE